MTPLPLLRQMSLNLLLPPTISSPGSPYQPPEVAGVDHHAPNHQDMVNTEGARVLHPPVATAIPDPIAGVVIPTGVVHPTAANPAPMAGVADPAALPSLQEWWIP